MTPEQEIKLLELIESIDKRLGVIEHLNTLNSSVEYSYSVKK